MRKLGARPVQHRTTVSLKPVQPPLRPDVLGHRVRVALLGLALRLKHARHNDVKIRARLERDLIRQAANMHRQRPRLRLHEGRVDEGVDGRRGSACRRRQRRREQRRSCVTGGERRRHGTLRSRN